MANPARFVSQLKETELFADLSEDAITSLAARGVERNYPKGQIIFSQGEHAAYLYVLTQGLLKVLVSAETGDEMLLTTLKPPATFGELALVDGGPRSASVEVAEPARVLVISVGSWEVLVREHPSLADGLVRTLASILRRLTDQAADFVFLDLPGRVAKLLTRAYESQDSKVLDLHLTQSDIAHAVGGSRQSVNQILGHLAGRGFIEIDGRTIIVKNPDALARRAGL